MTRSRAGPGLSWTRASSGYGAEGAASRTRATSAVMAWPLSDPDLDPGDGDDVVVVAGGVEHQLEGLGRAHLVGGLCEEGEVPLRSRRKAVPEAAEGETTGVWIQARR